MDSKDSPNQNKPITFYSHGQPYRGTWTRERAGHGQWSAADPQRTAINFRQGANDGTHVADRPPARVSAS